MHVHLTEASYRETSVRMVYVFYVLGLFASQYRAVKQPIATSFYSLARVIFTARFIIVFRNSNCTDLFIPSPCALHRFWYINLLFCTETFKFISKILDQTVLQNNNYLGQNLSTLLSLIVLLRPPSEFCTSLYFSITIPIVIPSSSELLVTSVIRTKRLLCTNYNHFLDGTVDRRERS